MLGQKPSAEISSGGKFVQQIARERRGAELNRSYRREYG
jgi:hypothetical protein